MCTVPIIRMSFGPTRPINPPKDIKTHATEYEHLIKNTISMEIINYENP